MRKVLTGGMLTVALIFSAQQALQAEKGGNHPQKEKKTAKNTRAERHEKVPGEKAKAPKREKKTEQEKITKAEKKTVDERQSNQEKRIQEGIEKGRLTEDETEKLKGMEKSIEDAEAGFREDGKLSRDESRQLQKMLNEASAQIWAEKHDGEGTHADASKSGKHAGLAASLAAKLESGEVSGKEAREMLKGVKGAAEIKRRLSNEELSEGDRSKLQNKYDAFRSKYFEEN
ncbi:MAG: hypothetical protein HQL31_02105 [Planctomycetes bacterium]|nr:hypothetical protein [Planctomycetota bacterium]